MPVLAVQNKLSLVSLKGFIVPVVYEFNCSAEVFNLYFVLHAGSYQSMSLNRTGFTGSEEPVKF